MARARRTGTYLRINGTRVYYEDTGGTGPAVVFSHGLLWNTRLYDPQVAALSGRYRCISYDHRGQGRSADEGRGPIDLDTLTRDAAALIDALGAAPVHFVGLSMGGYVGMRLAARMPDLVRSLTLIATDAFGEGAAKRRKYKLLNLLARAGGIRFAAPAVMPIMFGRSFLRDPAHADARTIWRERLLSNSRDIHRAVAGVIHRQAVDGELSEIRAPTLVLRGNEDMAIADERARATADAIEGARFVEVRGGGHTLTIEATAAVNAELERFLDAH